MHWWVQKAIAGCSLAFCSRCLLYRRGWQRRSPKVVYHERWHQYAKRYTTSYFTRSQLATACSRPLAKHCKVDAPAAAEAGSQAVGYRHCALQSQVCPVQLPLQQRRACSLMRSWPLSTL